MTPREMSLHREKCRVPAADGRFELYKVSIEFDGAEGRKEHGFPLEKDVSA